MALPLPVEFRQVECAGVTWSAAGAEPSFALRDLSLSAFWHRRLVLRASGNDYDGAYMRDDVLTGLLDTSGLSVGAGKLAGAWGRHPLLGRLYLPCYRAGTEKVAELRRKHAPERLLPALYGAHGLVDIVTLERVLA